MLRFIDKILCTFKSCFSRNAAFKWSVIVTVGLMLRSDKLGLTSVIRDLSLRTDCYECMIHFFRSRSWKLGSLRRRWSQTVEEDAPLFRVDGMAVLVGDGVKQTEEGRKMPAMKKLCQESGNSAKPEFIHGHMFGGLGILAGDPMRKLFCIPPCLRLHDGIRAAADWERLKGGAISSSTHIVQMVEDAFHAAGTFGNSLLLLDRYLLSVPALETLSRLDKSQGGRRGMEVMTWVKRSCTAYKEPEPRGKKRGRPPKKGDPVKVMGLFTSSAGDLQEARLPLYGKDTDIRYYSIDLLWGQKLYQKLRFVLVGYNGIQSILASTSLSLDPLEIIKLYSHRFRIECTFRELKQQVGAFCYHFWSRYMPKLSYFHKKGDPDILEAVEAPREKQKVLEAAQAIELHMVLSCVAIGTVQMLALYIADKPANDKAKALRYLRTPSADIVSEATIMWYLRKYFFYFMAGNPGSVITQLISVCSLNIYSLHFTMPFVCKYLYQLI